METNQDRVLLFSHLDKLSKREHANLRWHLQQNTQFSTPDQSIPKEGVG